MPVPLGMVTDMVTGMVTQISLLLRDSRLWQYDKDWSKRIMLCMADRKIIKITQYETFV